MSAELLIENNGIIYQPPLAEGVEWSTERSGTPGKLTFSVLADDTLDIAEGNAVRFRWNGDNIFYGFIFTIGHGQSGELSITAYDQLRYLKNKDSYVYEDMTAGQVVSMIADDFMLQTGELEDTGYVIASRTEDNQTLFDIIQNALDDTLNNTTNLFVLYDDFGKLTLKSISSMIVPILIDADTAGSYDYKSSIDSNTYNKIKLIYDNDDAGEREVYISQDSSNMNRWGVLQYYDTIEEGENGQAKADALLKLYNAKTRNLTVSDAFGDSRVRAGCMVGVQLKLSDVTIQNLMLVESCKHTFSLDEHMMEIKLRGGEFIV